jgi:UDP-N-acetylglucosamine enolpyruvyl transferase
LRGEVTISGSKNAALGIIAAAMVLDVPCRIENIPQVADAEIQLESVSPSVPSYIVKLREPSQLIPVPPHFPYRD